MRTISMFLAAAVASAVAAACYVGPLDHGTGATADKSPTDPSATDPSATNPDGSIVALNGLPCDVDALLASKCRGCHGANTKRAPMSLVTYEDLVAPGKSDPTKKVAELCVERMSSTTEPMPPTGAHATTTEIDVLSKWGKDGFPRGSCGVVPDAGAGPDAAKTDGSSNPPDASSSSVCSSGMTWTSPEHSTKMNPGRACITCHQSSVGDPILQVAGTVYPTAHEPDLCYGASGASVVVTDVNGRTVTTTTNSSGNFTLSTSATALVFPIKVKVVKGGVTRAMQSSPPTGDCNSCHTERGDNGAPGRIQLPSGSAEAIAY